MEGEQVRWYARQRIMKVAKAVAPWLPQAIAGKRRGCLEACLSGNC